MAPETNPESPFFHAGLSREARLLLGCAADADRPDGALIEGDLDWPAVIRMAIDNRVVPQLFMTLQALDWAGIDPNVRSEIERLHRVSSLHNLSLMAELFEILKRCRARQIDVLLYKGLILAHRLYGNLVRRQVWDMDLMVRPQDVTRLGELLIERGYRPEKPMDGAQAARHLARDCESNYDRPVDGTHVEIHWRILPRKHAPDFNDQWMWDKVEDYSVNGFDVRALRPDALLVVLGLHGGMKHQWSRLRWICDLQRLLRTFPAFDSAWALAEAGRLGVGRPLAVGLYLAESLLGASLPPPLRRFVHQDRRISGLAALVRGRLFRENMSLPGYREWRHYLLARAEDSAGDARPAAPDDSRLAYYAAVLTPEWQDREMLPRLPAGLSFLHYPARVIRLLCGHRTALIKRTT